MRIWRDIPAGDTIRDALSLRARGDRDVANIIATVNQYHTAHKYLYDNLLPRRNGLNNIARLIADRTGRLRAVASAVMNRLPGHASHLDDNDRRILAQLERRARAKAQYLDLLIQHYAQHDEELLNPGQLWAQMLAPQRTDGMLLGLTPGNLIERADPLHRSFDMAVTAAAGIQPTATMHSVLVQTWFAQLMAGATDAPLWLYLENTPFCTDRDVARDCYVVSYQDVGAGRASVFAIRRSPAGDRLQQAQMGGAFANYDWQPFDTQWVTGAQSAKGGLDHSLAYVWTDQKELYANLHNPIGPDGRIRAFHHSSFTSGGMVLCAGMIAANGGLVTYLSNDSGHYQPDAAHLAKIVRHLDKRFLFAPNARIHNAAAHADYTVAQFLALAGPAPVIPPPVIPPPVPVVAVPPAPVVAPAWVPGQIPH